NPLPAENNAEPTRLADDHFRCEVVVVNEVGLHVRPASMLVELGSKQAAEIRIGKGSLQVDAKSIFQLLSLSAETGSRLCIETRGADAEATIRRIQRLFRTGFDEFPDPVAADGPPTADGPASIADGTPISDS
ncbi:MAG: HPr family phosphocarrier protein, partial [Planctomycetia bacterium]